MSVVYVPEKYENEVSVAQSGSLIREIGTRALIIAGKTAYQVAGKALEKTLTENKVTFIVTFFDGYPTEKKMDVYAAKAGENQADMVIAVGGGRVMDVAKEAAARAKLSLVTIPTIAATCAAWTRLAIIYSEEGAEIAYSFNKRPPQLIIVDKKILLEAPRQYLIAGVADTLVKWYEPAANLPGNEKDFVLRLQLKVGEVILEFLEKDFIEACLEDPNHIPEQILSNALDSVIMLAGMVGSLSGHVSTDGLAHPFYNAATKVPIENRRLHGEYVAYGMIVQFLLDDKPREEAKLYLRKLMAMGMPGTLEELHLADADNSRIHKIAQLMVSTIPVYRKKDLFHAPELVEQAILQVNQWGEQIQAEKDRKNKCAAR